MLLPSPAVLAKLVERYENLAASDAEDAEHAGPQARRRLDDVTYTLCVSTGTRDIDAALAAARRHAGSPGGEAEPSVADLASRGGPSGVGGPRG
jgi:hypothetical protein